MAKHYDVFISYSASDKDIARKIEANLEGSGLEAWTDTDLKPGEDFVEAIDKAIAQCQVLVLLVSDKYLSSGWASYERALAMKMARESGKTLVPVILTGDANQLALPVSLQQFQAIDAGVGAEKIADIVRIAASKRKAP